MGYTNSQKKQTQIQSNLCHTYIYGGSSQFIPKKILVTHMVLDTTPNSSPNLSPYLIERRGYAIYLIWDEPQQRGIVQFVLCLFCERLAIIDDWWRRKKDCLTEPSSCPTHVCGCARTVGRQGSFRFSVPKWKWICRQLEYTFQEIFNAMKVLVCWSTFFSLHVVLKMGWDSWKTTLCILMGDPTTAQAERGVGGKADYQWLMILISKRQPPALHNTTKPSTMQVISNAQCKLYQNAQCRHERSNPPHNARPFTRCTANGRHNVHC